MIVLKQLHTQKNTPGQFKLKSYICEQNFKNWVCLQHIWDIQFPI